MIKKKKKINKDHILYIFYNIYHNILISIHIYFKIMHKLYKLNQYL